MRIRRSVTRFFSLMVMPAVTVAVVGYFGAYAVWGERGLLVLEDSQARLGIQQQELTQVEGDRARLAHRIALMEQNGGDPDLVEELARTRLMDGAANQVAIPRQSH